MLVKDDVGMLSPITPLQVLTRTVWRRVSVTAANKLASG